MLQNRNLYQEHYDIIFNELFKRVNLKYNESYFKLKEHITWSADEADDFHKWLSDYLRAHKPARGLFGMRYYNNYSRKCADRLASMFILNYGWYIK